VDRQTELDEIAQFLDRRGAIHAQPGYSGPERAALPLLKERRRIGRFKPSGPATEDERRRAFMTGHLTV
jgi:hypothetical protein